jgi:hypothetical protein
MVLRERFIIGPSPRSLGCCRILRVGRIHGALVVRQVGRPIQSSRFSLAILRLKNLEGRRLEGLKGSFFLFSYTTGNSISFFGPTGCQQYCASVRMNASRFSARLSPSTWRAQNSSRMAALGSKVEMLNPNKAGQVRSPKSTSLVNESTP